MANVIIGIHGLGNKPPKKILEDWWMLSMTEGLEKKKIIARSAHFEIAYWADIIHKQSLDPDEKDPESPLFVDEKYETAPRNFVPEDISTRKRIVDFLGRQMNRIFLNDDLTLNYSFITDAVISRYFNDLEEYYSGTITTANNAVYRTAYVIRERLFDLLQKHRNDKIMLISHSMGTLIAFDVMTFLARDIKINTFVTMGSPLGLPVVISRIAAEQKQRGIYKGRVTTPPGVVENWYNFSDILDKVAFNYRLSDYFNENETGVRPVDLLVVNDYETAGVRNPHKSFGYLRTPEFAEILNAFLLTGKLSAREKFVRKVARLKEGLRSRIKDIGKR
jgi:hypothetical protein